MNVYQIILKTVASTIDVLVAAVILAKGDNGSMKTAYCLFCLANLVGIWC